LSSMFFTGCLRGTSCLKINLFSPETFFHNLVSFPLLVYPLLLLCPTKWYLLGWVIAHQARNLRLILLTLFTFPMSCSAELCTITIMDLQKNLNIVEVENSSRSYPYVTIPATPLACIMYWHPAPQYMVQGRLSTRPLQRIYMRVKSSPVKHESVSSHLPD
jgi:hypothetical protein